MGRFGIKLLLLTVYLTGYSSAGLGAAISAASAAASAITSGGSMLMSSVGAPGYSVVCTIVVENWTKFNLMDPEAKNNGGELKSSPVPVLPGVKESFVTHKTGNSATGTYGSASWSISGNNRRAVVMWSCPYSFDSHSNWLAVGLNKPNAGHQNWFNQMYYGGSSTHLNFTRGEYYRHTKTISQDDDKFVITGTMGTSHKATVRIIVRPKSDHDLAPQIKKAMQKE